MTSSTLSAGTGTIHVEFAPGIVRTLMTAWRAAVDPKTSADDPFRRHFINNPQDTLDYYFVSALAWREILQMMKAGCELMALDLDRLRSEIETFVRWAGDGLRAHSAPQVLH